MFMHISEDNFLYNLLCYFKIETNDLHDMVLLDAFPVTPNSPSITTINDSPLYHVSSYPTMTCLKSKYRIIIMCNYIDILTNVYLAKGSIYNTYTPIYSPTNMNNYSIIHVS